MLCISLRASVVTILSFILSNCFVSCQDISDDISCCVHLYVHTNLSPLALLPVNRLDLLSWVFDYLFNWLSFVEWSRKDRLEEYLVESVGRRRIRIVFRRSKPLAWCCILAFSFPNEKKKEEEKVVVCSAFNRSAILIGCSSLYSEPLNMCQVLTNRNAPLPKHIRKIKSEKNHFSRSVVSERKSDFSFSLSDIYENFSDIITIHWMLTRQLILMKFLAREEFSASLSITRGDQTLELDKLWMFHCSKKTVFRRAHVARTNTDCEGIITWRDVVRRFFAFKQTPERHDAFSITCASWRVILTSSSLSSRSRFELLSLIASKKKSIFSQWQQKTKRMNTSNFVSSDKTTVSERHSRVSICPLSLSPSVIARWSSL